eukprot:g18290.t1
MIIRSVSVLAVLCGFLVSGCHKAFVYSGCLLGINGCNSLNGYKYEKMGYILIKQFSEVPEEVIYILSSVTGAALCGLIIVCLPKHLQEQVKGGGTCQSLVAVATGKGVPLSAAVLRITLAVLFLMSGGSMGAEGPVYRVKHRFSEDREDGHDRESKAGEEVCDEEGDASPSPPAKRARIKDPELQEDKDVEENSESHDEEEEEETGERSEREHDEEAEGETCQKSEDEESLKEATEEKDEQSSELDEDEDKADKEEDQERNEEEGEDEPSVKEAGEESSEAEEDKVEDEDAAGKEDTEDKASEKEVSEESSSEAAQEEAKLEEGDAGPDVQASASSAKDAKQEAWR